MDATVIFSAAARAATLLEGPYKWYAIAGIAALIALIMSRFIFKTLKWIFLLLLIAVAVIALWQLLK